MIAAVGVTQFMVGPLTRLAWVGGLLARARASAARLDGALAAPPAVAVLDEPVTVSFDGPVGVTRRRPLEVPAGALFGVVSDEPERAARALLGRERRARARRRRRLAALEPAAARAAVVVAPHEATLLSGTIRDNVSDEAGARARPRRAT